MNNYENVVFVSYAWGDESERTVNELEKVFAERGIRIIRDKKDLDYRGSIEAFEQRIGQGQCVILVISDKYLRSEHCMNELVEVDKNQGIRERVFPIILADASIYKAKDRLTYIKHWDEQIEQLNQAIKQVKVMTKLTSITTNLDKLDRIRSNFDHLSDLLGDMNALTPEMHATNGFSTLINSVERAVAGNQTTSQSEQSPSNNKLLAISWEEVASVLPRRAKDIERLMAAMYYRGKYEEADFSDVAVIADEYWRRARWSRPSNLSATANHCASKGWLSEAGKSEGRKMWRITRKGHAHAEELLSMSGVKEKENL